MANLKFSDFTPYATTPVTATSGLVAYEGTSNIQFTPAQLAPFTGIYAADGTIGTTRKALITDTIQFRNAGDTSDVLSLNTDGTFTLGLAAVTTGTNTITIGDSANTYSHSKNIAIGYSADSSASLAIAIGSDAQSTAGSAVSIGNLSESATTAGVSIGYASAVNVGATYGIAIGGNASTSGANSITLNSNSGAADNTTANTFGVYMTSNTTPDFEVVGGGESTLNTPKFKITGQAYTELHTNATNLVVDWDNGNVQTVTVSATTPTFAPTRPAAGATYILMITQGATPTGISWDGKVKWSGGAPTLSSTTGQIDVITLICYDAAANSGTGAYYGSASLNLVI